MNTQPSDCKSTATADDQTAAIDEIAAMVSADDLAKEAARWTDFHARMDADPQVQANHEAAREAHEAIQAALAAGRPWAEAVEEGKRACGRDDLNFDDRPRAEHHRREVFGRRPDPKPRAGDTYRRPHARRRAMSSGRPRASATRSSARSGDSGDDGPPDPASRPVEQLLGGLRELAFEYGLERIYELIPGEGDQPDRWKAKCPVHPDVSAYTLLITELPDGEADVWCSVGCDPGGIVRVLVPDREREALAAHYAEVLLWAQSFNNRRAA